ncbi:hypothetical protein LNP26_04035 [Klebsiella variicola subsp. variicola]|nr:hypothetical protein [Klebsiella variicola subsp. variicola]
MPVSFGILCRKLAKKEEPSLAGAAVNFILLILCASMGCQRQNGFLVGFVFFQDAGDTAFMHHHNPITHAKDFRQLRGDHNDRHPPIRQFTDQMINLRLRPDVDTAGRLIEN